MELKVKACYSQVLAFQLYSGPRLAEAISSMTISSPNFQHEGFNGYIETDVVFSIRDLNVFAELWDAAYKYPSERNDFYNMIMSGNYTK